LYIDHFGRKRFLLLTIEINAVSLTSPYYVTSRYDVDTSSANLDYKASACNTVVSTVFDAYHSGLQRAEILRLMYKGVE